ncbi:MAG: four helix bundle protein [Bacteroidales bacterium]|nr:four helix bundle protein [Bacteroidales bacterium]
MAKSNVLQEKSYNFAIRIVKLAQFLREKKSEYILSKQLIRSGTSIGANIEEASGAQSDSDFIAKLHISLKEAKESHYWIRLLRDTDFITQAQAESMLTDLNEIITLLTRSLKTIKSKKNKSEDS